MRVLIYTYGSRGDVQPFLALARALQIRGHEATLVAPALFEPLAATYGVGFAPRDDTFLRLYLDDPFMRKMITTGGSLSRVDREAARLARRRRSKAFEQSLPSNLRDIWTAARSGADLIVQAYDRIEQSHHIAEKLGVPVVIATLHPNLAPTWKYPSALVEIGTQLPRLVNRLSYLPLGYQLQARGIINKRRTEQLQLGSRRWRNSLRRPDGGCVPILHGFSPQVITPAPDWPTYTFTTGFWFLPVPDNWKPPERLIRFLHDGEPPIFIGLGGIRPDNPHLTEAILIEAAREAKVRMVIRSGRRSINVPSSPDVFFIDDVPDIWLFPHLRAVVHSGGVGVAHTALVAGVPQVICPQHNEQYFWGRRMHEIGVSPAPTWLSRLNSEIMAASIRYAVTDKATGQAARRIASGLRCETGTFAAVEILERIHSLSN
jgi:sterol 3beta-glucosyltransferase